MPDDKTKRTTQRSLLAQTDLPVSEPLKTAIKFNLSQDNLLPFVRSNSVRTPPKRPRFVELRSLREKQMVKTEESFQREEETLEVLRRDLRSPDVPREASNVILRAIETKGIGCVWAELE
jgi:hypothetical protein